MAFPGGWDFKKNTCNVGDTGPIPKLEGSPGEGNGNPLQHSCLENPADRTAWRATVHGVTKESDTAEHLNNSSSKGPLCLQLDSLLAHSLEFGWVSWLPLLQSLPPGYNFFWSYFINQCWFSYFIFKKFIVISYLQIPTILHAFISLLLVLQ